jgi:hypothetical protein
MGKFIRIGTALAYGQSQISFVDYRDECDR